VITLILERVIGFQGMWSHRRVARLNMRRQHECNRRDIAVLFAPVFERETDRVGVRHVAHQRLKDGVLQCGGTVTFQQAEQADGDGAEIGATLAGSHEQGLAGGCGLRQAIGSAMLMRRVLVALSLASMTGSWPRR
jgi:hypothetical protein